MATGKMKCMKSVYRWELKRAHIESANAEGQKILSPKFAIHQTDFQLELYPKGATVQSSRYMSIFLNIVSGIRHLKVKFHLSILGRDDKNYAVVERTEMFDKTTSKTWGTTDFIQESELTSNKNLYSTDNMLRICCEISYGLAVREMSMMKTLDDETSPPRKRRRLPSVFSEVPSTVDKSASPFEKYFDNERRSDVKFVHFDGRCIHAHAIVLENKSDAFSAFFSDEVSVASPGTINVKDIDYEVLYETIRFVYTDKVEDLNKYATKLLAPANRYMLDDLKALCEQNLCDKLSITNVIGCFILAEDYKLSKLRQHARQFFARNMKNIVHLPEFETVMSDRPSIALEIVRCNPK